MNYYSYVKYVLLKRYQKLFLSNKINANTQLISYTNTAMRGVIIGTIVAYKILPWNLNQNRQIFFEWIAFENVVSNIA